MPQPILQATKRSLLPTLASLAVAGCGAGTTPADEPERSPAGPQRSVPVALPEPVAGCKPAPAQAAAQPLEVVEVGGVEASMVGLYAVVLDENGDEAGVAAVDRLTGDTVGVTLPMHPSGEPDGGAITIRLTNGETACPDFALTVEPLPAAEGSFTAAVEGLRVSIEEVARRSGVTPEQLLEPSAGDLPLQLLPLVRAYNILVGPNNPESLAALARGDASAIDGVQVDHAFLDRFATRAGAFAAVDDAIAFLEAAEPVAEEAWTGSALAIAGVPSPVSRLRVVDTNHRCANNFHLFRINDANQLSYYMGRQHDADSFRNGARGKLLGDSRIAAAGVGYLHPSAKTVSKAWTAFATILLDTYEAYEHLFPSRLRIDVKPNPVEFDEDAEGPGTWTATAIARSQVWNVTERVMEKILEEGLGDVSVAGDALPEAVAEQVDDYVLKEPTKQALKRFLKSIGATEGENGFYFPEQCWHDIDVSDDTWTEARVRFEPEPAISINESQHGQYWPERAGSSELEVSTKSGAFGNTGAMSRRPVTVNEIDVELRPGYAAVEPGKTVTFRAQVLNARDTGLEWTTSAGYFDITADLGDGAHEAILVTPSDTDEFPVDVVASSTANTGPRARSDADRFDSAAVHLARFRIEFDPSELVVEAGQAGIVLVNIAGSQSESVGQVELSLHDVPGGIDGEIGPNPVEDQGILGVQVDEDLEPGTYRLRVEGVSGGFRAEATLPITVTRPGEEQALVGPLNGVWRGTLTEQNVLVGGPTRTHQVSMHIAQIGDLIEAGVNTDSYPLDYDLRGTLKGDTLSLVREYGGPRIVTYEGTVVDGTYSGTRTVTAPEGALITGTFDLTKEE